MSASPAFLRITDAAALPAPLRGAVVAVGNFDGVHRGHQAVLARALAEGERRRCPVVVLTFEPHPRTVFQPDRPVPRLTPAPLKAVLFRALGAAAVVERPFDRDYAGLTAAAFVEETLVAQLGAAHVVVGFDFRFGARRAGTAETLREAGPAHGFTVEIVEAFGDDDDGGAGADAISSSRIRDALGAGEARRAAALLGYRWTIAGAVSHGAKLGRTLGYPTANMVLAFPQILAHGIYAVRLRRADGTLFDGVASYGRRPTFDHGAPLFETFLFDFTGDLYGEAVAVSVFARLRGEERFESAEALVAQMHRDAAEARALLADAVPLGPLDAAITF